MKNNCFLMGNELASFVEQIINLKQQKTDASLEKVLLENDNISRTVSFVTFKDDYSCADDVCDKVFYVLDGSGIFGFDRDYVRYISGDIVPAKFGTKWSFESDGSGTKLLEVSALQMAKTFEENINQKY